MDMDRMDYESFYEGLAPLKKDLKDSAALAARYDKAIGKAMENGNLTEMKKTLSLLKEAAGRLQEQVEKAADYVDAFDTDSYFVSGYFARELEQACLDRDIDVKGSRGVYEMFPYKVRVIGDEEHAGEVYINRKKVSSFRPSFVADTIKADRDKLYKAKFNEVSFMGELAEAYDLTILKDHARPGSNLALTKIHKTMTPMARARKDYDMQAFSFDLARLYEKGPQAWVTKSGRQFDFGTSRRIENGIRVLSSAGVETYIGTIREKNTLDE